VEIPPPTRHGALASLSFSLRQRSGQKRRRRLLASWLAGLEPVALALALAGALFSPYYILLSEWCLRVKWCPREMAQYLDYFIIYDIRLFLP
jgi:hypothetical protein